jgi:hypothetical protein
MKFFNFFSILFVICLFLSCSNSNNNANPNIGIAITEKKQDASASVDSAQFNPNEQPNMICQGKTIEQQVFSFKIWNKSYYCTPPADYCDIDISADSMTELQIGSAIEREYLKSRYHFLHRGSSAQKFIFNIEFTESVTFKGWSIESTVFGNGHYFISKIDFSNPRNPSKKFGEMDCLDDVHSVKP